MIKKVLTLILIIFFGEYLNAQVCGKTQLPQNLQDSLVAFYPFCGNANDLSGNGNNGTVKGALSLTSDKNGNLNSAYYWPTSGDPNNYIALPDISTYFPYLRSSCTFSAWIYMDGGVLDSRIFSKGEWGIIANGTSNESRTFRCYILPGMAQISPTQPVKAKTWVHIALTTDQKSETKFFVNGTLLDSAYLANPNPHTWTSNEPFEIGRKSISSYDGFGGMIDDVFIFNRALSNKEVLELYQLYEPCSAEKSLKFNPFLNDTLKINNTNSVLLNVNSGYSSFAWNTGSKEASISVTQNGWYNVKVIDSVGCTAVDSVYVSFLQGDIVTNDTAVCKGTTITLASNKSWVSNSPFTPVVKSVGNVIANSDIIADKWGNIYVWGLFSDTIKFGSSTLVSDGTRDLFLAKYDQSGNELWALKAGTILGNDQTYHDSGKKLATDSLGNIYILGNYLSNFTFKGNNNTQFNATYTTTTNSNHRDGFLVKIDSAGNVLWGASLRGGGNDAFYSITVDHKGNPILSGSFNGCCPSSSNVTFYGPLNSKSISTPSYGTGFIFKLNKDGNILWSTKVYNRDCMIGAVTTDGNNNIYFSGWYSSWSNGTKSTFVDAQNSSYEINNPSNNLTFIGKINENGLFQWGYPVGANGNEIGIAELQIDGAGKLWLAGNYIGNPVVLNGSNGATLTANNSTFGDSQKSNGFIANYSTDGMPLLAKSYQHYGATEFRGLMLNDYGLMVYGNYEGQYNRGSKDILLMSYGFDGNWKDTVTAGGLNADDATGIAKYKNSYFFTGFVGGAANVGGQKINNTASFIWKTGQMFQSEYLETSYLWSNGAKTRTITVTPEASTNYSVIINDVYGLDRKDTIRVIVNDVKLFNPLQDTLKVKNADSVILNAGSGYSSFAWNTGSKDASISVAQSGRYKVEATDSVGCTAADSVYVSLLKSNIITNDTSICKGQKVTLRANSKSLLTNHLNAYYSFDGHLLDSSANKFHGSGNGTLNYTTDHKGKSNGALLLGSGYVTSDARIFQFTRNQQFTVSFWFTANGSRSGRILSTENPEGNFRITSYGNGIFATAFGESTYYIYDTVSLNQWHHYVYVYDNRNARVYIDNKLVSSLYDNSVETLNYGRPFTIGAKAAPAFDKWGGSIDELRVYDTTLSSQQVDELYKQSKITYRWWPTGDTTEAIEVQPTTTTSYILEVNDGINTKLDTVTITVVENKSFKPLQDTIKVNNADSVVLNAGSGFMAYQWRHGGQEQNTTIRQSGKYYVRAYTENTCYTEDSTYVSIVNAKMYVVDTSKFVQIAAGDAHNIALKADGSLWAWGNNSYGQLGDGSTVSKITPVQIGTAKDWKSIVAGGWQTLALKIDGSLWAWGNNNSGQLGDGSTVNKNTPVQIGTAKDWKIIAAGYNHTIALKADGSLWAWGNNNSGQLGDGSTVNKNSPLLIGSEKDWITITAGSDHTIALKADGSLWAWGANSYGQLGDGSNISKITPVQIGTAKYWKTTLAGFSHTVALNIDGSLWAWGNNNSGQLGDGSMVNKNTPMRIGTAKDWKSIASGVNYNVALKADGSLWAWGANSYGQLGDGSTVNKNSPIQIGTTKDWKTIAAGSSHSIALKSDGSLRVWGSNGSGQLGDGSMVNKNTPVQIGTVKDWKSIIAGPHTLALKADGSLWAWGNNTFGQLGDGSIVNKNVPVRIGKSNDWKIFNVGYSHSAALKSDGSLWAWGNNYYGQLGDGSTVNKNSPLLIGSEKDWITITAGSDHTIALKVDGSLWAWGANYYGQLGDASTVNKSTPVQIGMAKDWKTIFAGSSHTIALKSDCSLWGWGVNISGQLGDGTTVNKNTPMQIGTSKDWREIAAGNSHTIALKSDGSLWTWGNNYYGQLGDGTTVNKNTPVQIGITKDWKTVASGFYHTVALKADGSLWAWGKNSSGQLGDGSTVNKNTPVQIGTAKDWESIVVGGSNSIAMKIDGSLWAWGDNTNQQLGIGQNAYEVEPKVNGLNLYNEAVDTTICGGTSITLTASANISGKVRWSTGDTTTMITVKPTTDTRYIVSITDGITTSTDQVFVKVFNSGLQIKANKDTQCLKGNSFELSLSDTAALVKRYYQWNFGGKTSQTGFTHTLRYDSVGTYRVRLVVNNEYGCVDTLYKTLSVFNNLPSPVIKAQGDTIICIGDTLKLSSSVQAGNQWLRNGLPILTATGNLLNVMESGFYQTYNSSAIGCKSDTSKGVIVNALAKPAPPVVSYNKPKPILCEADTLLLTASSATGNQWYFNDQAISAANGNKYFAIEPGKYSVTTTNTLGCKSLPAVPVSITREVSNMKPAILRVENELISSNASQYKWYFNNLPLPLDTLHRLRIINKGMYKVSTSNNKICWNTSDPFIVQYAPPVITQLPDLELSAYPNPTAGLFYLQLRMKQYYTGFIQINIVDANGNTRWNYSKYVFYSNLIKLPINLNGAKGVFTVKVMANGYAPKAIQVIGM